jgi:hypothetical protein
LPVSSAFLPCILINQSVNCQPLPWIWSDAVPIACLISQLPHVLNLFSCYLPGDSHIQL